MNEATWKRQRDSAEKRANMLQIDNDRLKAELELAKRLVKAMEQVVEDLRESEEGGEK